MSEPTPTIDQLLAHAGWVKALARRIVAGDDAEDVAQETLLRALERPPRAQEPPRVRAWLASVARRFVLQRRRRNDAALRRDRDAAPAEAPGGRDVLELVSNAELHRRVVDAVLALPEPYRTTLLLRFFEELPPPAVAARQGVPLATVHTRLRRALALLRRRFADERQPGRALHAWIAGAPAQPRIEEVVRMGVDTAVRVRVVTSVVGLLVLAAGIAFLLERQRSRRDSVQQPATVAAVEGAASAPLQDGAIASREPATPPAEAQALGEVVDVVFVGDVRLTGRVVDEEFAPIAGARCEVRLSGDGDLCCSPTDLVAEQLAAHGRSRDAAAPPRPQTATLADGSFALRGLRHGLVYRLTVTADGYLPLSRHVPASGGAFAFADDARDEIRVPTLRLIRGDGLVVRVVDGDEQPVEGAEVFAGMPIAGAVHAWLHASRRVASTDGRGLAHLVPPAAGCWIAARSRDGRIALTCDVAWPRVRRDGPLELQLAEGAPTQIAVRLEQGQPLAGIEVHLTAVVPGSRGMVAVAVAADDLGIARFGRFPFPAPGRQASATPPGGTLDLFDDDDWPNAELAPDRSEGEIVARLAAAPIAVRFVDAVDGAALAASMLLVVDSELGDREHAWPPAWCGVATRGWGVLEADGTRGVVLLAPPRDRPRRLEAPWNDRIRQDERFRLVVDVPGHSVTWLGPFDPAQLPLGTPLELAIERGAAVQLVVRDSEARPIPTARAHVVGPGSATAFSTYAHHQAVELRAARADDLGRIAIGPLAHGSHRITIEAPGWLPREIEATIDDAPATPIEVILDDGHLLDGRVLLDPGEAAGRFAVALRRRGDQALLLHGPADDGRFEFSPVRPGAVELVAFEIDGAADPAATASGLFGARVRELVALDFDGDAPSVGLEPRRLARTSLRLDRLIEDAAVPGATMAIVRCVTDDGARRTIEAAVEGGRVAAELPPAPRYLMTLSEGVPAPGIDAGALRRCVVAESLFTAAELLAGLPPLRVGRGSLHLRLVDGEGRPLSGAATIVASRAPEAEFAEHFPELRIGDARTFHAPDAAGCALDAVPAGRWFLRARVGVLEGSADVDVPAGGRVDLEIAIERPRDDGR